MKSSIFLKDYAQKMEAWAKASQGKVRLVLKAYLQAQKAYPNRAPQRSSIFFSFWWGWAVPRPL